MMKASTIMPKAAIQRPVEDIYAQGDRTRAPIKELTSPVDPTEDKFEKVHTAMDAAGPYIDLVDKFNEGIGNKTKYARYFSLAQIIYDSGNGRFDEAKEDALELGASELIPGVGNAMTAYELVQQYSSSTFGAGQLGMQAYSDWVEYHQQHEWAKQRGDTDAELKWERKEADAYNEMVKQGNIIRQNKGMKPFGEEPSFR